MVGETSVCNDNVGTKGVVGGGGEIEVLKVKWLSIKS